MDVPKPSAPTAGDRYVSGAWDRTSYLPPAKQPKLSEQEALTKGRAIFASTPEQGKAEAERLGAFFERYPSSAANQIRFFHSYWAQNETFQKLPLQAYNYHQTMPIDDRGRPKNALWQEYARAVEEGRPQSAIEAAYLRAHIQEFKDVTRQPEFKQLYALATPKYRQIVEAYLDTLQELEGRMNKGEDPQRLADNLFFDTTRWLAKRGVSDLGFMATAKGVKAVLDPTQPLTKQLWGSLGDIFATRVTGDPVRQPTPARVATELSAAEAKALSADLGISLAAGRFTLTPEAIAKASVSEAGRGAPAAGPLQRYPVRWDDVVAFHKLHPDQRMAGADGVMQGDELRGVVRNVRARIRSNLMNEFFDKYPVPEAGLLRYSANMLAMNGTYAHTEMFETLGNAVMPVDNVGKPKNALWQAYADAYDRHKATGSPSMQAIESLWFKAHMEDFAITDTPAFQQEMKRFLAQAEQDPALRPMAIYTRGTVGGRKLFEEALAAGKSEEACFLIGLQHFARTMLDARTMPFLEQDLREAGRYLLQRGQAPLDGRGLPTDATMFARASQGLKEMRGLGATIARGLKAQAAGEDVRRAAPAMVDFARVLSPDQLKQVDPKVLEFYRDPTRFDVQVRANMPDELSRVVFGDLAPALSGLGALPTGKGAKAPLEMELYRDAGGGTHWDRYTVLEGKREPLFLAKFELEGKQLKETFNVRGKEVALYFDVAPHQGGLRLTLDPERSSLLASGSRIVFTTRVTRQGMVSIGDYSDVTGTLHGQAQFDVRAKSR